MAIRPAEAALAIADPARAMIGYSCAKIAEDWANRLFRDGRNHTGDDTEQNAFKHAYWNALMVKNLAKWAYTERFINGGGRLGEFIDDRLGGSERERFEFSINYGVWWAKAFGDAHESDPQIPFLNIGGNTAERHAMDYHNNEMGRRIAAAMLKRYRHVLDLQLGHEVMNYLVNGKMVVILREYDMDIMRHRI
jgi:hypothetical protein